MIIGHDLMVKLVLKADFGHQVLEWYYTFVPMKYPGNFLVKPELTKREM